MFPRGTVMQTGSGGLASRSPRASSTESRSPILIPVPRGVSARGLRAPPRRRLKGSADWRGARGVQPSCGPGQSCFQRHVGGIHVARPAQPQIAFWSLRVLIHTERFVSVESVGKKEPSAHLRRPGSGWLGRGRDHAEYALYTSARRKSLMWFWKIGTSLFFFFHNSTLLFSSA